MSEGSGIVAPDIKLLNDEYEMFFQNGSLYGTTSDRADTNQTLLLKTFDFDTNLTYLSLFDYPTIVFYKSSENNSY